MGPTELAGRSSWRRLFRALALSGAVCISLAMSDCPVSPSDEECGGPGTDRFGLAQSEMFTAPFPNRAFRDGGAAIFEWDRDLSGLCVESPESANKAIFTLALNSVTPDMIFEGRVYHAAFIQPYKVRLTNESSLIYQGVVNNIGLRQGNPLGGAAEISVELHVSMNSSGDIQADVARARSMLSNFSILTEYTQAK